MEKKGLVAVLSIFLLFGSVIHCKNNAHKKSDQSHKKDVKKQKVALIQPIYLDDSLERFLAEMTSDVQEQEEFRGYYSAFIKKQNRKHTIRKRRKLQNLRIKALNDIEVKFPSLYAQLEPYLIDLDDSSVCRTQRLYLTRYALFQKFQEQRMLSQMSSWGRTKKYAQKAGNKIAQFSKRVVSKFSHS